MSNIETALLSNGYPQSFISKFSAP